MAKKTTGIRGLKVGDMVKDVKGNVGKIDNITSDYSTADVTFNNGKQKTMALRNFKKFESVQESNDMDLYVQNRDKWTSDLLKLIKGKSLGKLKTFNIKSPQEGMTQFSVKVDELQLDWMMAYDEMRGKPVATVWVSSPNKKGQFEKKSSGKNASPQGVWNLINMIYNGKFARNESVNKRNMNESNMNEMKNTLQEVKIDNKKI